MLRKPTIEEENGKMTSDNLDKTHVKNRIQLSKKLLSFRLRNEWFRWVGIEMEILHSRLFSLQLWWSKNKRCEIFLTWAQNGKPKDELSLSTSKEATIRSPDIVQVTHDKRRLSMSVDMMKLPLPLTSLLKDKYCCVVLSCVPCMYYSITVLAVIITKRLQ